MKTLKDFTPEIKSKIQIYKDKAVKDLYSGKESKINEVPNVPCKDIQKDGMLFNWKRKVIKYYFHKFINFIKK